MDNNQENNLLTSSDYEHLIEDLRCDNAFQLVGHDYSHIQTCGETIDNEMHVHGDPPHTFDNEMHVHGDTPQTLESYMIKDDHDMKLDHLGHVQDSLPLEVPPPSFSPTGTIPCRDIYPGPLNFELLLDSSSSHRRSWVYSDVLNKVFIDMNKSLLVQFRIKDYRNGLSVRALPVYTMDDYVSTPVQRCDIHILNDDVLHKAHSSDPPMCFCANYRWVGHVVQSNHPQAIFEYDCDSDRHSVRVPLEVPQAGTDTVEVEYHFSCKTSCNRGMNRKPINVIFTLETELKEVLGRFVLPVKICSCPKRDKEKEEADAESRNKGSLNPCGPTKRRISSASEKHEGTKKVKIEYIAAPQENGVINGETMEQVIKNVNSQMSELINIATKQQEAISELTTKHLQLQNDVISLSNRIEPMVRAVYQLLAQGQI